MVRNERVDLAFAAVPAPKLGEVAEREGISVNQLISSAVAEKMSALMTEEYLQERAARGSRRKFAAALAKVDDVEPAADDLWLE